MMAAVVGLASVPLLLGSAGCDTLVTGMLRDIYGPSDTVYNTEEDWNTEPNRNAMFQVLLAAGGALLQMRQEGHFGGGGGGGRHGGGGPGFFGRLGHGGSPHGFGGSARMMHGGRSGHKSLDDGDTSKLAAPPGCPRNVLAREVPAQPSRLFVYCEWDRPAYVDIAVLEPAKEICGLTTELTKNGGMLDWDTASAKGPETYMAGANPPAGRYTVALCRLQGEGRVTATVVVQQNARMEGWSAKRYKITLPAPGEKPVVQPVAVVELK